MTEKKDPNAQMVDLLKTINLVNKLILELHDIPILKKLNAEIETTLKGAEQMEKTCDNCIHFREDEIEGALCYQKKLQKVDPKSLCPLWEDNKGFTHKIVYSKLIFKRNTVLDKITESLEVLANKLVYRTDIIRGATWTSNVLFSDFKTKEEAIAATIEELKREVEPNND